MSNLNRDDLVPDDIQREKAYRRKRQETAARLRLELDQLLWDKPRGKVPEWMIDEVEKELEECLKQEKI